MQKALLQQIQPHALRNRRIQSIKIMNYVNCRAIDNLYLGIDLSGQSIEVEIEC